VFRVKFHRILLGLSQRELARLTHIQQATISQIETGRIVPTADELAAIGRVLGCKPERLLDSITEQAVQS
jgi:transcriptional regulator with XRE-family HTH domain